MPQGSPRTPQDPQKTPPLDLILSYDYDMIVLIDYALPNSLHLIHVLDLIQLSGSHSLLVRFPRPHSILIQFSLTSDTRYHSTIVQFLLSVLIQPYAVVI